MPLDADHHTDDVARAAALLAQTGRNSLDWAALMRVVAEHRREAVEQRLDRDACAGWLDDPSDHAGRFEPPLNDAEVASIKVTARLYGAITRFGKEWQRVIETRAEKLNRCLQHYQATDSPGPADRVAAIMELRLMFEEIGYLVRDQAIQVERDLRELQQELLPYPYDATRGARPAGPLPRPTESRLKFEEHSFDMRRTAIDFEREQRKPLP